MKIICGDFNAKVGQVDMITAEIGRTGLSHRNAS